MPVVTLSSKHQITVPMEVVRAMGLKPGEKLIVEALDWRIVIMKESENRLERYIGSLKGVYGKTVEEIDRYVWEERASPERQAWKYQFLDIVKAERAAERIVERMRLNPRQMCTSPELYDLIHQEGLTSAQLEKALDRLVAHGGVRRIPPPEGVIGYRWRYYLVPEVIDLISEKIVK